MRLLINKATSLQGNIYYLPQVINTTTPKAAKNTTKKRVALTVSLPKMVEIFFITPVF